MSRPGSGPAAYAARIAGDAVPHAPSSSSTSYAPAGGAGPTGACVKRADVPPGSVVETSAAPPNGAPAIHVPFGTSARHAASPATGTCPVA